MGTIVGFNRIYKQLYVCINVNIYFEGILDAFFLIFFMCGNMIRNYFVVNDKQADGMAGWE